MCLCYTYTCTNVLKSLESIDNESIWTKEQRLHVPRGPSAGVSTISQLAAVAGLIYVPIVGRRRLAWRSNCLAIVFFVFLVIIWYLLMNRGNYYYIRLEVGSLGMN